MRFDRSVQPIGKIKKMQTFLKPLSTEEYRELKKKKKSPPARPPLCEVEGCCNTSVALYQDSRGKGFCVCKKHEEELLFEAV